MTSLQSWRGFLCLVLGHRKGDALFVEADHAFWGCRRCGVAGCSPVQWPDGYKRVSDEELWRAHYGR